MARALLQSRRGDVELVGINSAADAATAAHLLKYDSTHGALTDSVAATDDAIVIGGVATPYSRARDLADLPWAKLRVDVALECSGRFNDSAAAHLSAGAGKVLVSAPSAAAEMTVVYGVNHHRLFDAGDSVRVVSAASCTTNCLAPVAAVLLSLSPIESGMMTTVHSYTGDQKLLDASHKDLRRARAAGASIIPTKTGAAGNIGLALPELDGKLSGVAVRVPSANVSLVDLTCQLARATGAEEINAAMRVAAAGDLAGVLAVNDAPLVSVDFNGRSESAIFDATQTMVCGRQAKVFAWYDNEMGFSHRMLDVAAAMA